MKSEHILIDNLKCTGCATSIEKGLKSVEGVEEVHVDVHTSRLEINCNENVTRDVLLKKLGNMGYPEQGTSTLFQKGKSYVSCMVGKMSQE